MPERVTQEYEISLNAIRYPISGRVQQSVSSAFAQKVVIGDTNKDSQQRASVWAPTFKGGIGKWKIRPGEPSDRAWWSTLQLRYDRVVLPQLATTTAASGVSGSFSIGAIGELADEIYAAFGTAVRKYNNTTDSWGSTLATLPAVATDALTFRMGNVVYLAFATTGGYTYTSDGVTWTNDIRDALYLAYWDDALWGIDNTGLLWKSTAIGVEADNAQLALPNGSVTDLFVGRNTAGTLVLFAATTVGLFAHDNTNSKWLYTELALPYHPDNGQGSTRWRDSIYIPSGLGVYRYIQGANSAIVTVMGPDRDDGLPSDKRGVIRQLIGTHNDLLAILDGTTAPGTLNTFATAGLASHRGAVIDPDVGFSSILGWNEVAWETKWLGGSAQQAIDYAHVSNAYSTYRLWWAQNQRIHFMPLRRDIVNPNEITTLTYAASTEELISPWLDVGQDVDSLALSLKVEVDDATASETIAVDYAINYSDTWTSFGTISANGVTEYLFPNSTAPTGTTFRSIRFRLREVRGSTNTLTPALVSVTFLYIKVLPAQYGFTMNVNLERDYNGNTPKQMRDSLRTAIESRTKVEFTYRNDIGTDLGATDRRFYVLVISATNLEETGDIESGASLVSLVEV